MADGEKQDKWRRFRVKRRVPEVKTYAEQAMDEVERDSNKKDKGPLDDGGMQKGCYGCLGVSGLLFAIMIASIITTCMRPGSNWVKILMGQ